MGQVMEWTPSDTVMGVRKAMVISCLPSRRTLWNHDGRPAGQRQQLGGAGGLGDGLVQLLGLGRGKEAGVGQDQRLGTGCAERDVDVAAFGAFGQRDEANGFGLVVAVDGLLDLDAGDVIGDGDGRTAVTDAVTGRIAGSGDELAIVEVSGNEDRPGLQRGGEQPKDGKCQTDGDALAAAGLTTLWNIHSSHACVSFYFIRNPSWPSGHPGSGPTTTVFLPL